jgi:hypothetical protein
MQSDTRKLLTTGTAILLVGAIAALLMLTVFGGVTREGPHTNGGWHPIPRPRQTHRRHPQPLLTRDYFDGNATIKPPRSRNAFSPRGSFNADPLPRSRSYTSP